MKLSFRHYYFRWTKNLFILFFLFTCLLTLSRAAFALYFGDVASLTNDPRLLTEAFFLGLRYDLMPISYVTALPFLILNLAYVLPGKFTIKLARFFITSIMVIGFYLIAWIYVCDYGFYSYFQDHINILFYGFMEDDTVAMLITIWKNYNVPVWLTTIFATHYVFYRLIRFLFSPFEFDLKAKRFDWKVPVIFFSGLIFLAFCARGNFTRLPLSIEDAHISSNDFINKLSINGPISLNRAMKIRKTFGKGTFDYLAQFQYQDWQVAFKHAHGAGPLKPALTEALMARTPVNGRLEKNPPHVVMVVMESFGSYWSEHDADNFNVLGKLKNHFKEGILFRNFLPAENGTIGSIVSVATSQVIRPGARFLSESEFMSTALDSGGHLPYKQKGYTTHFAYGGKLGWRDLGKYLKVQGYDNLWGADEMKDSMPELNNFSPRDLGNEWGIFDEYLYSFIEEQLKTATTPQFFLVLTTSNHPPFEYPVSYNPLPLTLTHDALDNLTLREELARKRFLGLQYANQKVGEFLNRIRSTKVKDTTVVALTGDHSFWIAKGVGSDQEFKRFSVPFFISLPPELMPAKIDMGRFGSHEDIFPTLFNLTLSDQQYVKLGDNLLEDDSIAMNSSGLVANKHGAYHHNTYWKWKDLKNQILEPSEETPELLRLKQHREGLISITDLYLKKQKQDKPPGEGSDRP
ncbi:MAG TPA: sulfatase-like hydrolase/transferase [Bacteriovoracaceae bacterium]|nr:sulfatase-like hydrolase/transferase [Bacteriovoracaceae bacterium]